MSREKLPNDLLWENGHASELALFALADGEDALLPSELPCHVHSCDACAMKLGTSALDMRGVARAVQSVKPWLPVRVATPAPKKRAERLPLAAMIAAVLVATLGAVPTLLALPHRIAALLITIVHAMPVVSRGGVQVVEQGLGGAWVSATGVCAALLVVAGITLTRVLPRPATS